MGLCIPGSIDSRAGPHGYGVGAFSPSFCGSESLKFSPSVGLRRGCSQPLRRVFIGGKPNKRREKNCGENCILGFAPLTCPFCSEPILLHQNARAASLGAVPELAAGLPQASRAVRGHTYLGRLLVLTACSVPALFTALLCLRHVPPKAGLARLIFSLLWTGFL